VLNDLYSNHEEGKLLSLIACFIAWIKQATSDYNNRLAIKQWDGEIFWREDSISLEDNVLHKNKGFEEALYKVVPKFDPFGETEISQEQWERIGEAIPKNDAHSAELFQEADEWLKDVFATYGCFTIIGL